MQHLYYSLDQVIVETPISFCQYIEWTHLLFMVGIICFLLYLVKKIIKNPKKCNHVSNSVFYASLVILLINISVQTFEFHQKAENFEKKQIRSDYLEDTLIYSVLKDRPYTVYESSLSRTNQKETLDSIRGDEVIPPYEYRQTFNIAKRVLLRAEEQLLYEYAAVTDNPNFCEKDQYHQLYRCQSILKNPNGARIYMQSIVYYELKAYQDYLRYGFREYKKNI